MLLPRSDANKIIFTLKKFKGSYDSDDFSSVLVDNKMSENELQLFFQDIYDKTKNFGPLRQLTQALIGISILYFLVLVCGIVIEISGFKKSRSSRDDVSDGILGFGVIAASSLLFVLSMLAIQYRRKTVSPLIYKAIEDVVNRHKYKFDDIGLTWKIPLHCEWLELWLEYKNRSRKHSKDTAISLEDYDEDI
jgi:hypothetical protein